MQRCLSCICGKCHELTRINFVEIYHDAYQNVPIMSTILFVPSVCLPVFSADVLKCLRQGLYVRLRAFTQSCLCVLHQDTAIFGGNQNHPFSMLYDLILFRFISTDLILDRFTILFHFIALHPGVN